MGKLFAWLNVFRKGGVVLNPAAWKRGEITVTVLAGLMGAVVAVGKLYGFDFGVTDAQIVELAAYVLGFIGLFVPAVAVASSDKVGVLGLGEADKPAGAVQGYSTTPKKSIPGK